MSRHIIFVLSHLHSASQHASWKPCRTTKSASHRSYSILKRLISLAMHDLNRHKLSCYFPNVISTKLLTARSATPLKLSFEMVPFCENRTIFKISSFFVNVGYRVQIHLKYVWKLLNTSHEVNYRLIPLSNRHCANSSTYPMTGN
jgi:hypothetical protein